MANPTLAEIRYFQIHGKLPDSLKKRQEKEIQAEPQAPEPETYVPSAKEVIQPIDQVRPTMDNTKAEIIAWLEDQGIAHDARRKKEDLLKLIP